MSAHNWIAFVRHVSQAFVRHDMTARAAAVSFFALFAIFSAIGAFVAFYGLVANPQTIVDNMQALGGFVPADVVIMLINQMQAVSEHGVTTLVFVGTLSLVIAVWSAQQGVAALMVALDIACGETIPRGRLLHTLKSLFTALGIIFGLLVVGVLAIGVPLLAQAMSGQPWLVTVVRIASMALAGVILWLGLMALYRWVPQRRRPRWRQAGTGAALVVGFWTVASILFSVVLAYSHSYTLMYGSMGSVLLLLTLTYVTVATVLVGAELNARMADYNSYERS